MALVAYGSSDSESDNDYQEEDAPPPQQPSTSSSSSTTNNVPIASSSFDDFLESPDLDQDLKFNLPAPKTSKPTAINEEQDDEFLAKKPIAIEKPPPPPPSSLSASAAKSKKSTKIQIVLPALSTYSNVPRKNESVVAGPHLAKPAGGGLLDMLPKPKQFTAATTSKKRITSTTTSMVPDSLSRRPPAAAKSKTSATITSSAAHSDSDSDGEDFFSLNKVDDKLPEVNINEINAMVASRSAAINQKVKRHEAEMEAAASRRRAETEAATEAAAAEQRDQHAISALCGIRGAKRSKRDEIEIIELSGEQLNPNREEWLRNQLQATTEYQPRGLVDTAEPGTGTKRKHQITYLAHQAKANEQELQAMWATNRHARRQTQNKYGF